MKETIILLYFLQTDYGRRLLRFLTRKKNKQIRLELMTERERVMWRTETENQRIVVLTDDEGLYAEAKKEVVLLGKADDRQQKKILQYQRADGIYEDLLKILGYKPLEEQKKIQKGVIMFFFAGGNDCYGACGDDGTVSGDKRAVSVCQLKRISGIF